jgi:FMN phosphatase YigB (HAD superfamily)
MIKGIIFDWVETLSCGNRELYPYSKKVLIELKDRGYKLGLITIAGHGNTKRKEDIKICGVWDYFDCIIIDTKKDSEMYLQCMKKIGTTPKTTAIVDDRILRGIQIGNALGCITYWTPTSKYSHEIPTKETGEPTYIIKNIEELLKTL